MDSLHDTAQYFLRAQSASLKRLIALNSISIVDIAKRLGVDRKSLYNWMRGENAIPDDKLSELSELFEVEPVEIRYGVSLFNKQDLITVIMMIEKELDIRNIRLTPERKAAVVAALYTLFQSQKRLLHKQFLEKDFADTSRDFIGAFL